MENLTCLQCKSPILPTDHFCAKCGAVTDSVGEAAPAEVCWFCKKYPAEAGWGVPVKLAKNPKIFKQDHGQLIAPTYLPGEKRVIEFDVRSVNVPRCSRCGSFTSWNKKISYMAAGGSVAFAIILEYVFSVFFRITNMGLYGIIPLFLGSLFIVSKLGSRKRRELGIENVNTLPKLAQKHPEVLKLIEQEWQIDVPKGYQKVR